MRSDEAALFGKIGDGIDEPWLCRIGADVENENLAVVEAPGPKIFAVVRKPHVMGLATAADGHAAHHLAVSLRFWIGVDCDELVGLITELLLPERPNMNIGLLAFYERGRVGGKACLV